jgi:hypothetical protein
VFWEPAAKLITGETVFIDGGYHYRSTAPEPDFPDIQAH